MMALPQLMRHDPALDLPSAGSHCIVGIPWGTVFDELRLIWSPARI